jgi:hypothetical protein
MKKDMCNLARVLQNKIKIFTQLDSALPIANLLVRLRAWEQMPVF